MRSILSFGICLLSVCGSAWSSPCHDRLKAYFSKVKADIQKNSSKAMQVDISIDFLDVQGKPAAPRQEIFSIQTPKESYVKMGDRECYISPTLTIVVLHGQRKVLIAKGESLIAIPKEQAAQLFDMQYRMISLGSVTGCDTGGRSKVVRFVPGDSTAIQKGIAFIDYRFSQDWATLNQMYFKFGPKAKISSQKMTFKGYSFIRIPRAGISSYLMPKGRLRADLESYHVIQS